MQMWFSISIFTRNVSQKDSLKKKKEDHLLLSYLLNAKWLVIFHLHFSTYIEY